MYSRGFIKKINRKNSKRILSVLLILTLVFATTRLGVLRANASFLAAGRIALSDSRPSQASTTYTVSFTSAPNSVKCINVMFADSVSNLDVTNGDVNTSPPTGMTTTSAAKVSVSGGGLTDGNWTLYNSVNGVLSYQYSTGAAPNGSTITITTSGITNPSAGTFYAVISTYTGLTGNTCDTNADASNYMALVTTSGISASVTVDPSLSFSIADYDTQVNGGGAPSGDFATSTSLPFGTVAANDSASDAHTLTVSTNGEGGYTVYTKYTQALTNSNNNTIADTTGTNASPGSFSGSSSVSAFGYIIDDSDYTQFTSNTWAKFTTSNLPIATANGPVDGDANHIQYKVHVSNTQPPGTYTTTIVHTATPTY
jgi:hypothetical protein